MRWKTLLLIGASFLVIAIIILYAITSNSVAHNAPKENTADAITEDDSEIIDETKLVVPESPIGTLGLISALAVGFGIFMLKKKR